MTSSIKISPPNSILFVSDSNGGDIPDIKRGTRIWSTPACIAFGCLMEQDGKTEITIGAASQVDPGGIPAFDGELETPNRAIVVSTVEWKTVLKARVPETRTRTRIWTNHPMEPDKVIIGLG